MKASALVAHPRINLPGAIRMAPRKMEPGPHIVTILCRLTATAYQSKLFNPEFLASKDLPVPKWLNAQKRHSVP